MFSATWPKEVKQIAKEYCKSNERCHIQIGELKLSANSMIRQEVIVVDEANKYSSFCALLQ